MPTTRIAMAATTLAMLTSSVQVNTPMPAIVSGMPMLRMPPGIGRIQSPYVVFDAMIIRISLQTYASECLALASGRAVGTVRGTLAGEPAGVAVRPLRPVAA